MRDTAAGRRNVQGKASARQTRFRQTGRSRSRRARIPVRAFRNTGHRSGGVLFSRPTRSSRAGFPHGASHRGGRVGARRGGRRTPVERAPASPGRIYSHPLPRARAFVRRTRSAARGAARGRALLAGHPAVSMFSIRCEEKLTAPRAPTRSSRSLVPTGGECRRCHGGERPLYPRGGGRHARRGLAGNPAPRSPHLTCRSAPSTAARRRAPRIRGWEPRRRQRRAARPARP